jgi:hypothetical protein
MNTRERLIELMTTYKIDRREVSELVRVKRDVVDHWLLPNESRNHQEPPEMAIELLEYKLRDRGSGTGGA